METKLGLEMEEAGSNPADQDGPQDEDRCLSELGITVRTHESYELDVMARIARKVLYH